jgi:hypothetical protein
MAHLAQIELLLWRLSNVRCVRTKGSASGKRISRGGNGRWANLDDGFPDEADLEGGRASRDQPTQLARGLWLARGPT